MNLDLEPGDFVINPSNKSWGIGQIQSIIKNKATGTPVILVRPIRVNKSAKIAA